MSNFVVSARKYRPSRFDEVVGQSHVSQTLKNALQNDHLAHAFLFCGPRGVGKTTCARILAKVLNCLNRTDDFEPCNQCESCTSFANNASFNISELDAASNNSVDHIRALVEQVRFPPQKGEYKVFIIDEVHMLSQAAFNAFLKTLEEPPSYAIFILATTEKHKIIPTILSRCQIFDFRRIQVQDTVQYLEEICQKEGIQADPDALHIIAQKADGALRDALSIFDRIVSFSGKTIAYNDVITNLNILDYDYYFRIVDALTLSDISNVLLIFDDILKKGFEADIFINGLAEHLRNLLVCRDESTLQLLEVSDALKQKYLAQAQNATASFLLSALSLANDCDVNYKMARNKRLHTEMAIIKMAHISQAIDLSKNPISIPVEKKKYDAPQPVVQKASSTPNPTKEIAENQVSNIPAVEQQKTESTIELSPQSVISESPKPTSIPPKAAPKPSLADRLKGGIPKLTPTLSLTDLEKEVTAEDATASTAENLLTIEKLTEDWQAYAAKVTSNVVRITMQQAGLALDGETITVTVGSKRSEGHIREEYELMPYLRKQLNNKKIVMQYAIDPARSIAKKAPEKPKILTPKEKFNQMKEQNPLVEEIYKRFDFQLED